MSAKPYWEQFMQSRRSRRALLQGSGAALTGSLLGACATSRGGSSAKPSTGTSGQPRPGGTLNVFSLTNIGDLDIAKTGGQGSSVVSNHTMSRIVRFKVGSDPKETFNSDIEGDIATSWESPDAITWTFKIRQGMKFHNIAPVNGHAVEAEDVRQSLKRELAIASPASATLTMIDANQIQAPAPDTVVFKLKSPTGNLTKALGNYTNAIFPREAAVSYDASKVVIGSGPFTLDSYTPDVAAVFKKNPAWYEANHPYIDTSRAAIIPDEAQQLAQFTAGNLDIVKVSINNLDAAQRSNPKAQVLTYLKRDGEVFIGHMNLPDSPYRDVRVRHALSMAIDRDAIGKAALGNHYTIGHLVQPSFGKWTLPVDQLGDAAKWFKYDPTAAKQLLQAAGATDAFHSVFFPSNGYGTQFVTVVEAINSMLNAVGLKTRLVPLDYQKDFLASGKGVSYGNYPADALIVPNVGAYTNAEDWLLANFTPGSTRNKSQVEDQTLFGMINKMSAIVDENERLKAVYEIERYLADAMYYVPSVYPYESTFVQPRVQNFEYSVNVPETESYAQLWLQT